MAVGLLGVGGGVVDGVGVVFLDYLAELYRVTPAFGAHRLAEKLRSRVRGADVAAVVLQELAVEPVGAGELAELLLERRETQDGLAGHRHQLAVREPREALGEIALDRVGVDAPVGGLGIFLVGLDETEKTADHLFDRVDRLLDLGIAGENLEILLDRLLDLVLGHLLGRCAELHLANLGQLFRLDPRLDIGVVVLAREFAYLLRHLAGVGGPRGLGILDKDVERMVVRAELAALAGRRPVAEEQRLDALVVALRLLVLSLRLVPQHLREHEAAERHRRELPKALLALGVELDDRLVELLELRHVLVDRLLGLRDIALQKLDVGLHRDGAAEVDGTVLLPEELVDDLLRGIEELLALLDVGLVGRELQVHLGRFARDVAPCVRVVFALPLVDLGKKPGVDLHRLVEALVADENLAPGVARLHVELADLLRGLGERLEELVVDLRALGLLAAEEEVVGDLEARRPVFRAGAVGESRDLLLGLLELAQREHAADLYREELRLGLGPFLLRRLNDGLGEVGVAVFDERLDVADLELERGVCLLDGSFVCGGRLVVSDGRNRRGCDQHQGRAPAKDWYLPVHHEISILQSALGMQVKSGRGFYFRSRVPHSTAAPVETRRRMVETRSG